MNIIARLIRLLVASALAIFGSAAQAQYQTFFPNNATINYPVTATYAVVGFANSDDFTNRVNGSSPTVTLASGSSVSGYLDTYNGSAIIGRGGNANSIDAYAHSMVTMNSGKIQYGLYTHNSSVVNIRGGTIGYYLDTYDNSTVNFSNGLISDYMVASDNSTVGFSGGTISGFLQAAGSSTVNVSGGRISSLGCSESATLNVSGGVITGALEAGGSSALNLRGGYIFDSLYADNNSTIHLYGIGLSDTLISQGVGFGAYSHYRLSGQLMDGTDVTNKDLYVADSMGATFTITSVPEPSGAALLAGMESVSLFLFVFRGGKTRRARNRALAQTGTQL